MSNLLLRTQLIIVSLIVASCGSPANGPASINADASVSNSPDGMISGVVDATNETSSNEAGMLSFNSDETHVCQKELVECEGDLIGVWNIATTCMTSEVPRTLTSL